MPAVRELSSNAEAVAELSARVIPTTAINGPDYKLVIDGERHFSNWWIAAPEIVFKENAVAIFDADALSRRKELFLVCKKLTIEGGVARVTWFRAQPSSQPDSGQAPSGPAGGGQGASGGSGNGGQKGVEGNTGMNAPDLTFFVQTVQGPGNLEIDFAGGPGGLGGKGQNGGDGGPGQQGTSARQSRQNTPFGTVWLPSCEAGPGQGGNGGPGGQGGPGGDGGRGGSGGTVTIGAAQDHIAVIRNQINTKNDGGNGGDGGEAGAGGNGGAAGPEGQLASFCNSAGRNGNVGSPGAGNSKGERGASGSAGAQFDSPITEEQFSKLFGL